MKNAIILHGVPEKEYYYDPSKPSESNAHWLPWLQKELVIRDIKADTPEVPHSYDPRWETWCREVERYDIGSATMLVGHSGGGGFWLRYLSERPDLHVGAVVLVGPWLDPKGTVKGPFFRFSLDRKLASRTNKLVIFHSHDDSDSVQRSVRKIVDSVEGVQLREFDGLGHFKDDNLGSEQFPELRDELLL
jgi:predicted alpha/beta hydrolase family esterase